MTAQTGRTVEKYIQVLLGDSSNSLIDLSAYVASAGGIGLKFDEVEVSAYSDAIKNFLTNRPSAPVTLTAPFDTVLNAQLASLNGVMTPRTFAVQLGIRHAWVSGEPVFGLQRTSTTSGYIVTSHMADMKTMIITATLQVFGPTAPGWGTAALTG